MYSNNSELNKSFLQAKMASFSKLPLAEVFFPQANGQQTTVSVEPCSDVTDVMIIIINAID